MGIHIGSQHSADSHWVSTVCQVLMLSITAQQWQTFGYSSTYLHCVCGKDCAWIAHIDLSKDQDWQLGYQVLFLDLPFSLLWVLGQVLAFLWAFAFSSMQSVMLTRIDDIYIPSSFNILRPSCPYATFTIKKHTQNFQICIYVLTKIIMAPPFCRHPSKYSQLFLFHLKVADTHFPQGYIGTCHYM